MTINELLIQYLTKTLGKSPESISELLFKKTDDGALSAELNDECLSSLEDLHAEHVKATPAEALKAEYDRGHQQGKFEALSKEEETLRKKYGLESKGKLSQLIDEAVAKTAKLESSEDKILVSPLYLKLKEESEAQIEALKSEFESKLSAAESKAEKQIRFNESLPAIDAAIIAAGVDPAMIMPGAKKAFLTQFEGRDIVKTETGTYIKDADGNLVKDKHQHPVKLEAFISETVGDYFVIQKQNGVKSPGNEGTQPPQNQPAKWNGNVPKTQAEFNEAIETVPIEQRSALFEAYAAAQKK